MLLINLIVFVLVLGIIVAIHEFGHFYVARKVDILCHEFSIGMGPIIYQKRKDEVLYSLRAIPLGGYVAMAGEELKDAYIKKGQNVGLVIEEDKVTEIRFSNLESDFYGVVLEYDLYGKDGNELYIKLKVDGEEKKFLVNEDAKYIFEENKEMWITPANKSFENKTLLQRFLVIFAGPVMNFLLAFILLFVVAIIQGAPSNLNKVGKVNDETQGLQKGDVITSVNNKDVETWDQIVKEIYKSNNTKANLVVNGEEKEIKLQIVFQGLGFSTKKGDETLEIGQTFGKEKQIKSGDILKGIYMSNQENSDIEYIDLETWDDLINYLQKNEDKQYVYIRYMRDGKEYEEKYDAISSNAIKDLGAIPIGYVTGFEQSRKFDLLYLVKYPILKIGSDTKQIINTFKLLFNPKEKVGVSDLSGPVGIYSLVSSALSQGIISLLIFTSFLSINIGFLNLMPIPALDGGRILFIVIEAITGKPVNKKVENTLILITFILLMSLIIFVTFKDVGRLIR